VTADNSFQRAYEAVAAPLAAWAHLRCRGPLGRVIDADDLVQEVVLAGWRAHERFDPGRGSFRAWLFGVANRVAAEALRQSARRATPLEVEHEPIAELTTISRRVRRREAMTAFLDRLDELDADDRDLVAYRGIEGLDHRAVAELLGISPEAAGKRWQRLRDRIATWPAIADLLAEHSS
jgi:RNA polymerase sigma-70 factor (ECF subfamily)